MVASRYDDLARISRSLYSDAIKLKFQMNDFTFTERPRRWYVPLIFILACLIPISIYLWYDTTRYDLPKLKPYNGAEEDLFAQTKCLVNLTESTTPVQVEPSCRFAKRYQEFWLTPKSLDTCFAYSTDNATTPLESPKRMEFDFMCEGKAMRANFSYKDGKYQLEEIGMTSP